MKTTSAETQKWYSTYYREKGTDRNDLLNNPQVLFQHLAFQEAIVRALRVARGVERANSRILDVGCGSCGSLATFLQLGFMPSSLYGIDILEERIKEGRLKYPNITLLCGDAAAMSFDSASFDLVSESTMFVQLTDESLAWNIAREMIRVCKPEGYLLLVDWRYGKPGNKDYRALSRTRINKLFDVGGSCTYICEHKAALVPPVGRFLSSHLPSLYFVVRRVAPFLAGATVTLLRRHS